MSISVYGWGSGYITTAGFGGYYESVIDLIPWMLAEYFLELRGAVSTRDKDVIYERDIEVLGSRNKLSTIPTRDRNSVPAREKE